ncbi:hypothetical protein COO60DRAFT_384186 [Scenedesmus sp. NREL 46B-D3]|nr:hypothetical protein COO60DRAFT_384186 [Scenedesmus sp. NREL 46B-D3]
MTPSNHAELMKKLYKLLGVAPSKVTHELRVFAAQAMYEMGVSLERIGHWLLDSFGTSYIVPGFTPEALLALGFWPGAAQKDFSGYWAERFHVAVPLELIYALFPGLKELEAEAAAAQQEAAGGPRSGRVAPEAAAVARVLRMGAVMVVQDALELAERFPDNPIHKLLMGYDSFRDLLFSYKNGKRLGKFASQRPLTVKQQIQQSVQHMQEKCLAAITSAAELNWQGYEKLLRELTRGTTAAPAAADTTAAGELPPSPEQQQRIQEQLQQLELEEQEAQQQDVQQHDDCFGSAASVAAAAASQGQLLCTPSGAVRLLHEVAGRAADTLTPGGDHYTAFMTGREDQQLPFVQQPLQQQQQPLQQQQQHAAAAAAAAAAAGPSVWQQFVAGDGNS